MFDLLKRIFSITLIVFLMRSQLSGGGVEKQLQIGRDPILQQSPARGLPGRGLPDPKKSDARQLQKLRDSIAEAIRKDNVVTFEKGLASISKGMSIEKMLTENIETFGSNAGSTLPGVKSSIRGITPLALAVQCDAVKVVKKILEMASEKKIVNRILTGDVLEARADCENDASIIPVLEVAKKAEMTHLVVSKAAVTNAVRQKRVHALECMLEALLKEGNGHIDKVFNKLLFRQACLSDANEPGQAWEDGAFSKMMVSLLLDIGERAQLIDERMHQEIIKECDEVLNRQGNGLDFDDQLGIRAILEYTRIAYPPSKESSNLMD